MKLSLHLHLHFAFLDYAASFLAGVSILCFPKLMAAKLFFPEMAISTVVIFTLQLFAFMLIVFASHFAYHIHCSIITHSKIRATLWMLFIGDLLHLFVYYRGVEYNIFKEGYANPGVLPNIIISSYAAISRLIYLFFVNDYGLLESKSKRV